MIPFISRDFCGRIWCSAASRSAGLAAIIVLGIAPVASGAQEGAGAQSPADLLTRLRALALPAATDRITVYYDPGHEAKALRLRALVQDARQFFADSLGVSPELSLAVLERRNWDRLITWQPYGLPGVEGTPPVAFLPATDDGVAAEDALALGGMLSDSTRRLIAAAGTTWPEASRRYVDLVGLHELGHAFAAAYGISVRSKWLNELLATYFCYAYLRAARPREAMMWEGILQAYREAVTPEHRSIADFERLYAGVGARNYVWYQARFQQMVEHAHGATGVGFLRSVRAAFPRGAAPVSSQDEVLRRLDAIVPGFMAWGASMK